MWLLQDNPPPSHMTIDSFMNKTMLENIDRIFADVNEYIFQKEQVDLNHVYIDGTKISANAGKYSWVWKKSCEKNRIKLFAKITELLENMNASAALLGVKFDIREEYAIEYLEEILNKYIELVGFDPGKAVHGKGNHKTSEQRLIEKFSEYIERLKKYAERIKICGNDRNSYSKTDHDATFMRMKRDHMGNDQLLPGYNIQCEDCSGCPHKEKCCKCKGNRIVRLNEELTQFHAEVLNNLNSIPGALLLKNVDARAIKLVFGVVVAVFGVEMLSREYRKKKVRSSKLVLAIIGVTAGVLCGLFGVGALLAAYVSRVTEGGGSFKANISAVFIVDNTFRIVLYSALGLLTLDTVKSVLLLIPFALLGLYAGIKCSSRMDEKLVRKITSVLLVLSGISLILKNL